MATVKEILARKSTQVFTTPATATVLDAIRYMNDERVGALVVTDGGRVAGMFTERDVLRRVVAAQLEPAKVTIGEVMTASVISCTPCTSVEDVSRIMMKERVRHVPVLDENGALRGLVSIGDINAYRVSDQEATINYLHTYIHGAEIAPELATA